MKRALMLAALLVLSLPAQAGDKVLNVQKLTTPKGIEVWLAEDKTVPVVSMNFSFEGGLVYDPADKPGVGRMVSILLDEGAEEMKSQAFQAKLSDNAISMGFTAGRDAFYGQLKTLKSNKDTAFGLLRLALRAPRFDNDAVLRMRNANLSQIKDSLGDPVWLAARVYNGMVFEGHAYAQPGFGNLESVPKITKADLQKFVASQFARDVLKVAVAGDISAAEAEKVVDEVFGDLPENAAEVEETDAPMNYAGKTILLPLDTPQTTIIAGETGIRRDDKDWSAAVVMNYILGGSGLDSRLMTEIREKRGLTYGVYTNLNTMKRANLLQANFSSANEKAADALHILKKEWARLAKEGPTAKEVEDAKSYLTGSLLLELTSTNDISGALNGIQRDDLDYNYINRRNAEIAAVTAADVQRVAARLLNPENLTFVLVGQPKNVTADIMLDAAPGMGTEK